MTTDVCPGCGTTDTELVTEESFGNGWERRYCRPCDQTFQVVPAAWKVLAGRAGGAVHAEPPRPRTDEADGPVILHLDRKTAELHYQALVNETYGRRHSDPDGAARARAAAHTIRRHLFATRPLVYRPAPVAAHSPMPNAVVGTMRYHEAAL